MSKSTKLIITLIILAIFGLGIYYWFFFIKSSDSNTNISVTDPNSGFLPLNRNVLVKPTPNPTESTTTKKEDVINNNTQQTLPKLRQISLTPVGSMFASTTKLKIDPTSSTTVEATIVRYVDRGTGHVYQANDISPLVEKISNTTLPKIYEGYWNKNLNLAILRYLKENTDTVTNFYAELRQTPDSISTSTTPFEIKGRYLSPEINQIAVSPTGEKVFTWNTENSMGIGYVSSFDEKNKTKIFESPITQVNIDWPEQSTVTITTKGLSNSDGYSYKINTKTTETKKILGNVRGLSVKMSSDGKQVIYSSGGKNISTKILNIKDNSSSEIIFSTLVDKCVWSKIRKNEIYCAVPIEIPDASYPEDWYKGSVLFTDQIWILDTNTKEVHLLANLLNLSKSLIDATQLTLDPKENFLYFINKRDLSLWSLDLNQ